MRRQAQQWDKALELACALDISQVGELSFLQAQVSLRACLVMPNNMPSTVVGQGPRAGLRARRGMPNNMPSAVVGQGS